MPEKEFISMPSSNSWRRLVDIKRIDHVKPGVRTPHCVLKADQQKPQLIGAFRDIELVQRDAGFVIENGIRNHAVQRVDQTLIDFLEEHTVQITTKFILHHPFAQAGGKENLQALLNIFRA